MMTDCIKILFGSDFHFGMRNMSQEEMTRSFALTIFPLLNDTDIFFINGDFFDDLISFDSNGFNPLYDLIMDMFRVCEQNKVTLRILQGTWSHDRNQCTKFEPFYRNHGFSFNFKFISNIDLEEINIRNRNLKILYAPDNLPYKSSEDVLEVMSQKMLELGWSYVDYTCLHGFFDFTYPKNVSKENTVVYREPQFSFVRKIVDVGHVHQYRVEGKAISNGSFDRGCFGDEDPKGCIRVLDYPEKYTAQFIKNVDAAIFDTLVFTRDDTTETITSRIEHHLSSLKTNRQIRIRCVVENTDHINAIRVWMKDTHPDVGCKVVKSSDCSDKVAITLNSNLIKKSEKRIVPTPKTISTFIRNHIPEEYTLEVEAIDTYLEPTPH